VEEDVALSTWRYIRGMENVRPYLTLLSRKTGKDVPQNVPREKGPEIVSLTLFQLASNAGFFAGGDDETRTRALRRDRPGGYVFIDYFLFLPIAIIP